ncbi:hypothetical protein AGMMS49579_19810 [Spirochaetia bacterium]|nr:hypothetical protein AGMMS49579_19810 [Spirochaetia bacterium]
MSKNLYFRISFWRHKGIAVIHSIYDQMLKTDDYRDRMDIEKYAL